MRVFIMLIKKLFILLFLVTSVIALAEDDLISLIGKAEALIESTFKGEELTEEYYKSKIKKIIDSDKEEEKKISEIKKIIDEIKKKGSKRKSSKAKKVSDGDNSAGEEDENSKKLSSEQIRESLMIVQGKQGSGSGFITELNGKKVAITNIHVILGNTGIKFLDCHDNRLQIGKVYFAHDRDIAVLCLDESDTHPVIPLQSDVSTCRSGARVLVAGNSQGAGVVTRIPGTLKGIGPKVLEVDAKFVQGNSGSPIISDGKVIGIATFAVKARENWVNKDTGFEKVRRFGTRIDTLDTKKLQRFKPKTYNADLKLYTDLKHANETCIKIFNDFSKNKYHLNQISFAGDITMQRIAKRWNDAIDNPRFGSSYMNTLTDMIKCVEEPAKRCKARQISYGFIQEQINQQLMMNKELLKTFKGFKQNLQNYRDQAWRKARGF